MIRKISIVILFILMTTCKSLGERENNILNFSNDKVDQYEKFLVDKDSYSTNGKIYHNKYYNHLIGIARYLSEETKLKVNEKSLGFYYDKIENIKTRLYLGMDLSYDIDLDLEYASYYQIAIALLQRHLKEVLFVLFSCKSIFNEKEVVGIVAGFHWKKGADSERMNIWISKRDISLFEKNLLTLNEIIIRNTVTDTSGNVIRLKL